MVDRAAAATIPISAGRAARLADLRNDRGFTLIEVLIAFALMAIVAVIVLPQFNDPTGRQLNRTAEVVLEAADRQRSEAMTSGAAIVFALPEDLNPGVSAEAQSDIAGGVLTFFPDGSSTGGSITLSDASGSLRINLDWATGETSLESPDGDER